MKTISVQLTGFGHWSSVAGERALRGSTLAAAAVATSANRPMTDGRIKTTADRPPLSPPDRSSP